MAAARQGLPVRLDRAPQRGAAFALTRASRRARSIGSRSRATGSSLIFDRLPAVAPTLPAPPGLARYLVARDHRLPALRDVHLLVNVRACGDGAAPPLDRLWKAPVRPGLSFYSVYRRAPNKAAVRRWLGGHDRPPSRFMASPGPSVGAAGRGASVSMMSDHFLRRGG